MTILSVWHQLQTILPRLMIALAGLIGLLILVKGLLIIGRLRALIRRRGVLLELTPPAGISRSPDATAQLFKVLHGLSQPSYYLGKFVKRQPVIALEITATREQGIRYLMEVEAPLVASVRRAITAYLPEVKVRGTDDLVSQVSGSARIVEFKQTGHFGFSLAPQVSLGQHDPMAYLTGAMTKLRAGELMSFQLVVRPWQLPSAQLLERRILGNENVLSELNGVGGRRQFGLGLRTLINNLLFGMLDMVGDVQGNTIGPGSYNRSPAVRQRQSVISPPQQTLNALGQQLLSDIHAKVAQPLFEVDVRFLVATGSRRETKQRLATITSALASYSTPYQTLQPRTSDLSSWYRSFKFQRRWPAWSIRRSAVLSADELASLYHFPPSHITKTDNLVTALSRTLPAPLSLKQGTGLDVILGRNNHHGATTDIGLTDAERERHVFIVGGTGNGKTTMLLYAIVQDIRNGKGLAVIDPHGDLATTLLRHIPKERLKDVVYFNPDDLDYPIGLNLLELPEGLGPKELLREQDFVTEAIVSVFRKIFSDDDSGGHRIEYVLRNCIQTAFTVENATIFTIYRLLINSAYRKQVTAKLEDEDLKSFWNNEYGRAGDYQRVKMGGGITAKIGRFRSSASARQILEQPKSTINFDDILDSGKILICNVAKGLVGEDTSELFGITILAKLQLAGYRRARKDQQMRKPFYLYVDEFQNFATPSFVQLLSEARKYKLFLTMAEQSTSQQDEQRMVETILNNVGTVVCFRSGSPADERLLLHLLRPSVDKGEMANLPTFNFYMKISAIHPQEPLSGETVLLEGAGSQSIAGRVITSSRALYAAEAIVSLPTKPEKDEVRAKKKPSNTIEG